MEEKRVSHTGASAVVSVVLLIAAFVMGFMAIQCLTTEMYKLYSTPYQGCSSRYAYYEKQAELKKAEAIAYQQNGQETLALNATITAENWQRNANEARSYINQHVTGAVALGVGTLLALLLAFRFYRMSVRPPEKKE